MGSNETLIAPESDVASVTDHVSTMPISEAGYTYERSDGIVERAMSAEDAIARCPVLGKLAIEAPEQANVLLELAAAGREKMNADAREEPVEKLEVLQNQAKTTKTDKQAVELKREALPSPRPKPLTIKPVKVKLQPIKPSVAYQDELIKQQTHQRDALSRGSDAAEPIPKKEVAVIVADKAKHELRIKPPKVALSRQAEIEILHSVKSSIIAVKPEIAYARPIEKKNRPVSNPIIKTNAKSAIVQVKPVVENKKLSRSENKILKEKIVSHKKPEAVKPELPKPPLAKADTNNRKLEIRPNQFQKPVSVEQIISPDPKPYEQYVNYEEQSIELGEPPYLPRDILNLEGNELLFQNDIGLPIEVAIESESKESTVIPWQSTNGTAEIKYLAPVMEANDPELNGFNPVSDEIIELFNSAKDKIEGLPQDELSRIEILLEEAVVILAEKLPEIKDSGPLWPSTETDTVFSDQEDMRSGIDIENTDKYPKHQDIEDNLTEILAQTFQLCDIKIEDEQIERIVYALIERKDLFYELFQRKSHERGTHEVLNHICSVLLSVKNILEPLHTLLGRIVLNVGRERAGQWPLSVY